MEDKRSRNILYKEKSLKKFKAGSGKFLVIIMLAATILSIASPLAGSNYGHHMQAAPSAAGIMQSYNQAASGGSKTKGVNPFQYYQSEPAPIGIADFGIGPGMIPYSYNTSSFIGSLHVNSLEINGTAAGILANDAVNGTGDIFLPIPTQLTSCVGITSQLNVNFQFNDSGNIYDYWIQNVAVIAPINSTSSTISFENNIWNFSSPNASMHNSSIKGNGSVGTFIGTGYYATSASSSLPGNDVTLNYPSNILLRVASGKSQTGQPEVIFQYNDGYGWVTYDNAYFIFAHQVNRYYNYVVNGYNMNPGGLYYDSELILGGPGDGLYVSSSPSTDISMTLRYWNGHNYQYVPNAFNFGSDTAESMSYVTSNSLLSPETGSVGNIVLGGHKGTLSMSYNISQLSVLSLVTPVSSGEISLNGKNYSFTGGMVNLTIAPGSYNMIIFSEQGNIVFSHFFTLYANETLNFNANDFYPVTFTESGLPAGTTWSVTMGSTTLTSRTCSIVYYLPNGTYYFTAQKFTSYYTSAPASVVVNGRPVSVDVYYSKVVYKIEFKETGLPAGMKWFVNLSNGQSFNSITSTLSFAEPNGTYSFNLKSLNSMYSPNSASGSFVVNGQPVSKLVTFTSLYQYSVTFDENGLPAGTSWSVAFDGITSTSSGSSILFLEHNGSYGYTVNNIHGYTVFPQSGTLVINGQNLIVSITFLSASQYMVVFNENGLPSDTKWSVTLNNMTQSTDGTQIIFQEVNGNYQYNVGQVYGYSSAPSSGIVKLHGANQQLSVTFTQKKYSVTFSETGLPPGSQWTVVLNGVSESSTNSSIIFMEPDGIYNFSTYSITLYGAFNSQPSSGTVTVNNANATQSILFVPNASGIASTATPAIPMLPIGTAGTGGAAYVVTKKFGTQIIRSLKKVFRL